MDMITNAGWAVKLDMFRKWFIETNHKIAFLNEQEARLAFVMHFNYKKKWTGERWQ